MAIIWAGGAALILSAVGFASVWLYRTLSARRLQAAADAYAEREMARTRLDGASVNRGPFRTAARVLPNHRAS
jgi:hypothetical protein